MKFWCGEGQAYPWVAVVSLSLGAFPLKQRKCMSRISPDCVSWQASKTPKGLQMCLFIFNKPQIFPSYGGNPTLSETGQNENNILIRTPVGFLSHRAWSREDLRRCQPKRSLWTLIDESQRGFAYWGNVTYGDYMEALRNRSMNVVCINKIKKEPDAASRKMLSFLWTDSVCWRRGKSVGVGRGVEAVRPWDQPRSIAALTLNYHFYTKWAMNLFIAKCLITNIEIIISC